MRTMEAIRIQMEGDMTSFRYPHFMVGRQPSYPVPPPSTVYGHVCAAFGSYINPRGLMFAYSFSAAGHGDDLEDLHIATAGSGKKTRAWPEHPENVVLTMQPTPRELLIKPAMILYLTGGPGCKALLEAFRSPRYAVVLGRSQDLMSYRSVNHVSLVESDSGYFENTILTLGDGARTSAGIAYRLPRFIDTANRRHVEWGDYLVVRGRVRVGEEVGPTMWARRPGEVFWVDQDSPEMEGEIHRIIVWHSFVESDAAHVS